MPRSITNLLRRTPGVFLLALATQTCHAGIYKWVDENGRTHYSERASDAGNAKTTEIKVSPPSVGTPQRAGQRDWERQQWLYDQRQARAKLAARQIPSLPGSKEVARPATGEALNGDAAKCDLARKILNGRMRHTNGLPTDQYDRDVASNDVRSFCHDK